MKAWQKAWHVVGVVACVFVFASDASLEHGPLALHDAAAVVGRPLTPVSYAGVARRTTRRAAVATTAAAATVATVATLPTGCVLITGDVRYRCGSSIYRPVYDGPDVVYVVEK